MPNVGFPYQRLPQDALDVGPWERVAGEERLPVGQAVEGWDYSIPLTFGRRIALDPARVFAQARLKPDARLQFAVLATVGRGAWRKVVNSSEITIRGPLEFEVEFRLDGRELQGELELDSQLLVTSAGSAPLAFSARRPGSRIWNDSIVTNLEGSLGRLPMAVAEFSDSRYRMAPWFVDLSLASLEASFLGSVQLLVNRTRADVLEHFHGGHATVIGIAAGDLVRQILYRLISDAELDFTADHTAYPDNSLGAVASDWFGLCFPDQTVEQIRNLARNDLSLFDVIVYSTFAAVP